MNIKTFQDLIDWSKALHHHLSECLATCAEKTEDERAKWLMSYIADHEKKINNIIERYEQEADSDALSPRIYDFMEHQPIDPQHHCDQPYASMGPDEIVDSVMALHKEIQEVYRYLQSRADIPHSRDLLENLMSMEEHESSLIFHQSNRMHDL